MTPRRCDRVVTVRLGVQLLGSPLSGEALTATGRLDSARGGVGLSSAEITDREGRPVARCVGRNAVLTDDLAGRYGRMAPSWSSRPTPWRMIMPHRGEDPTRDGTTMVAHPDRTSLNSAGVVQGGALAGIAARGLVHALDVVPDDFSVSFIRPVGAAGQPVMCRVVVEHGGRRLRVGRAELVDERGRLYALAGGTAYRPYVAFGLVSTDPPYPTDFCSRARSAHHAPCRCGHLTQHVGSDTSWTQRCDPPYVRGRPDVEEDA